MIKAFQHALSIPWSIHPVHGAQLAAVAYLVQQGKMELSAMALGLADEPVPQGYQYTEVFNDSGTRVVGRVAIHTIEGPLMRADQFCGPSGMITMAELFREADADDMIDAHVLRMHSPGGTVEGTEYLAQAIAQAEKPVVVSAENIFSAAYWIAAGADHIMFQGSNSAAGSIGVQLHYLSFARAYEKAGIDEVLIRAKTSPDKNKYNYAQPSEEDIAGMQADMLDPIDANFMGWVREYRPGVSEDALTGATYFAEQAIQLGLGDSIGSLEDAVLLAFEMADPLFQATSTDSDMLKMKKKTVEPSADQQDPTLQQQFTELKEKQAQADEKIIKLEEAKAESDKQIAAKAEEIKALKDRVATLEGEVKRLANEPATEPADDEPDSDPAGEATPTKVVGMTNIDAEIRQKWATKKKFKRS